MSANDGKIYVRLKDRGGIFWDPVSGQDFVGHKVYLVTPTPEILQAVTRGALTRLDAADGVKLMAEQEQQQKVLKDAEKAAIDAGQPHKVKLPAPDAPAKTGGKKAAASDTPPATSGAVADPAAATANVAGDDGKVPSSATPEPPSVKPYPAWTNDALKAELTKRKIDFVDGGKKADFIKLLEADDAKDKS